MYIRTKNCATNIHVNIIIYSLYLQQYIMWKTGEKHQYPQDHLITFRAKRQPKLYPIFELSTWLPAHPPVAKSKCPRHAPPC